MIRTWLRVALGTALLGAGAALARPPVAQPLPAHHSADAGFASLEHEYVTYMLRQFPVVATYLGGSVFDPSLAGIDARLRDYSPAALQKEDARLGEFRARFSALAPANLSARRRIDRSVALAQIAFLLHAHEVRHYPQRSLDSYVDEPFRGVDWQIQAMAANGAGAHGTEAEWRALIARTGAIPAYLAVAERQLTAGVSAHNVPDWRVLRDFGVQASLADAEYFAHTLPQLAAAEVSGTQREALLAELQGKGTAAAAAYRHLHDLILATFFADARAEDAAALRPEYRADCYAIGEAEYDWALKNNLRVSSSAAELYAGSHAVVQATRAQMQSLAGEIIAAHGWSLPAGKSGVRYVLEQLSQNAPHTDAEMIEGYRRTGQRLVDYARRTGLFEVPADYRLDVVVTPPPLRASIEGAAYYAAAPFKEGGVGRFYVTPTDDDLAQLRELHNYAAMPDLAAHEGFPGHDWYYRVLKENRARIAPLRWLTAGAVEDSSSMWQDSMASEGWALYSESLPAEPQPGAPHGFYSPEERLYQLGGELLRDLRVRLDTGLHTGRLSFEEAVTLHSETLDFLPGSCTDAAALRLEAKAASCKSARAAITRYARWPTQAITYRLGKEQILALRKRAQAALGARYSAQRFHLEFMKQGTIPAGYFGEELLRTLRAAD